tara:strand:+ start:264 stop:431 length:168 start_codon:yes stop_codon:yes gene_type:complete
MRLLVDDTDTHRLYMEKTEIGIRKWIIEETNKESIKVFNGLWYKDTKMIKILRSL